MIADEVVAIARSWIDTPYHHQASVKAIGCDCLGLVRGVWREIYGIEAETPPPYDRSWGDYTQAELMLEAARRWLVTRIEAKGGGVLSKTDVALQPGDVLVCRPKLAGVAKHCGIVSAADRMVHAYSGIGVRETGIGTWRQRIAGVFTFPEPCRPERQ